MKNILVLCTGNSCRSQMAEGYLRHLAQDKATIYSAGMQTPGVNPRAMADESDDIFNRTSNKSDEYRQISFGYVITVCDHAAQENCPYFPYHAILLQHNFADPAKVIGTKEETNTAFRNVRHQIKAYCQQFVANNLKKEIDSNAQNR